MQQFQALPVMSRMMAVLSHFEEPIEVADEIPLDFFEEAAQTQLETVSDRLNIFTPLHMTDYLEKLWIPDDPKFRAEILNRKQVRDQIEYLQRLCGKTGRQATTIATELVGDMDRGTDYPPAPLDPPVLPPQITAKLYEIIDGVTLKKKETTENSS